MLRQKIPAPPWHIARWLNVKDPPSLEGLRGRVIALHAFQMLCPGCVSHGLPQTQRIAEVFPEVAVIGLHTVFEHHDVMTPAALAVFVSEYRIRFPVAIDEPSGGLGPIPKTMAAYGLEGTPSLVLIDREGNLRARSFGRADDMAVGARIAELLAEPVGAAGSSTLGCDGDSCAVGS